MKTLLSASTLGILLATGQASGQGTLLPVISKVQVLYSLVGHHSSIADRVNFYNTQGIPAGNSNYVVPHLVFEPIVTLYNPHNTTLTIDRSRVMISNPPVGFRFKKNNDYLRNEWAGGVFTGLAQFQITNDNNPIATKTITLVLGGGTPANYSGQIVLEPGETRTFSLRVETNWTWGLETAEAYRSRSFFDWDSNRNLTNIDGRTNNPLGAEAIAGFDFRAGFQTDHISTNRSDATKYPFETNNARSWVAIKTTDTVSVEVKGINTTSGRVLPDFQLSLLRGVVANPAADLAKKFDFNFTNLIQSTNDGVAVPVSRTYFAGDLLQLPTDLSPGGKVPLAVFTIVARSAALQQGKFLATPQPAAHQLYETRLDEVADFSHGFTSIGPSDAPASGVVMTRMQRTGNLFILDIAARPTNILNVRGTSDPTQGFPDDLNPVSTIMEGPENSGIYKITVDVTGRGERYFVRIER